MVPKSSGVEVAILGAFHGVFVGFQVDCQYKKLPSLECQSACSMIVCTKTHIIQAGRHWQRKGF